MSKKMEEVRDAGVRVLAEDFLTDIKSSGKALQELVSLHAISPWGAEVKVENQASSAASKSGALATKSTGKVKEEEGKQWVFSVSLLKGNVSFITESYQLNGVCLLYYCRWKQSQEDETDRQRRCCCRPRLR